jgi:D-cysteine desulfhydrase
MSGNKVRKLEYLLHDAIRLKADTILTWGGEQSNHARATAAACAALGLRCNLLLWGSNRKIPTGNLFLDKMFRAEISFLKAAEYFHIAEHIEKYLLPLKRERKKVYVVPEGGSAPLGILGYASSLTEDFALYRSGKIRGICVAAGSGGTSAGLLVGAALLNLPIKIYAVNVLYDKEIILEKILRLVDGTITSYFPGLRYNPAMLEIIDGYSDEGYKRVDEGKLKVIGELAAETGILLDPAYTGKAFCAFVDHFLQKKNNRVLFLHTGGLFGVFPKSAQYLMKA